MTWKFPNPHDPAEVRDREKMLRRIDRWWHAFSSRTGDLDALFCRHKEWDLPAWMHRHLQGIQPRLMWEFGAAEQGGHYLVITPESARHLRPLVETILERAPKFDGWTFFAYRQPEGADDAAATVEARVHAAVCPHKAQARIGEHNLIDLVYRSDPAVADDEERAMHAAFVATESLLGEEVLDKWVGTIEAVADLADGRWLPLDRLRPTVDALIDSVRDQLPDKPCHEVEDVADGYLLRLEPKPADDYAARYDLLVANTRMLPMWKSAHSPRPFYSERFSRHGERFCYLKLDGTKGLEGTAYADRGDIEDALDEALKAEELGAVIGGGTGLRYSYVDLALTDVGRGAAVLRKVLREGRIGRRTWLQFFDCEWEREWIGIWDDAPAPPMEAEE